MIASFFRAAAFIAFFLTAGSAFAAGGTCPTENTTIDPNGNPITLTSLGISNCFYVSKSTGSDSNSGTSESSPWAHLPGMPSCTGNCASLTPAAGEGFILKGGDTWLNSDLGIVWQWSGTSSNPFYIGVDKTWWNTSTCGSSSWCRPIFNAGLANVSNGALFQLASSPCYVIVDDWEITGMLNSGDVFEGNELPGSFRVTQMYFHGWGHGSTGNNNVGFVHDGPTGMMDHNILDGSDSSQNTFNGVFQDWSQVQYNYFNYLVSSILGNIDVAHDNMVYNTVTSADGDHCNGFNVEATLTGLTLFMYNNVIANGDTLCGGGVPFWMNSNTGTLPNNVGYMFGNIEYDLSSYPYAIGNHPSGNYGTYYIFNNTIDCTVGGGCTGSPPSGPYWNQYENNNHTIGGSVFACPTGGTCGICNNGTGTGCTDLVQTESAASAQGYTSAETYPYSPISSCTKATCSTLQSGTNYQSWCTTLAGLSGVGAAAAGSACQYSGSVGCAYNTTSHTLSCPNDAENARPSTGAWDIGAYQFSQQGPPPDPPSGLQATVE